MTVCFHEDRLLSLQGQSSRWPGSLANDSSNRSLRAAGRQFSGPWPVETFQRIIVPCRTFLLPLSVCASPDDPQHRGMSWHSIGNYDREPEGKTNPSEEIGKCLSHFAKQELWSLVRFKKQNSEDMACCACPFPCLAHNTCEQVHVLSSTSPQHSAGFC